MVVPDTYCSQKKFDLKRLLLKFLMHLIVVVKSLLTFIYYLKRHKSFFLKIIEDLVVLLIKDILRFQMFKIILISF